MLRGVELPEIGSIKDRIMTRMFAMEQAQKVEDMNSLSVVIAIASRADQAAFNNLTDYLEKYRNRSGYRLWSNDAKIEETKKQHTDEEMLAAVDRLGDLQ